MSEIVVKTGEKIGGAEGAGVKRNEGRVKGVTLKAVKCVKAGCEKRCER